MYFWIPAFDTLSTSALGIFLSAISILSVTSCSTLSGEAPGYKVTTIASLTLNSGSSSLPSLSMRIYLQQFKN